MRKGHVSLERLMKENKEELLKDEKLLEKIDQKVDNKFLVSNEKN